MAWPANCLGRLHISSRPRVGSLSRSVARVASPRLRIGLRADVGSLLVHRLPLGRPGRFNEPQERTGDLPACASLRAIVIGIGTFAAFASFDLDPGSAFFLCAMYFAVTNCAPADPPICLPYRAWATRSNSRHSTAKPASVASRIVPADIECCPAALSSSISPVTIDLQPTRAWRLECRELLRVAQAG